MTEGTAGSQLAGTRAVLIAAVCSIFFGFYAVGYAESVHVSIEQVDERTKVTVSEADSEAARTEEDPHSIHGAMERVEAGTMDVAETSTEMVGKGTDSAVDAVRKFADSVFAKFFRTLDLGSEAATEQTA